MADVPPPFQPAAPDPVPAAPVPQPIPPAAPSPKAMLPVKPTMHASGVLGSLVAGLIVGLLIGAGGYWAWQHEHPAKATNTTTSTKPAASTTSTSTTTIPSTSPTQPAGKAVTVTDKDTASTVSLTLADTLSVTLNNPGDGGYAFDDPVFTSTILTLKQHVHTPPASTAMIGAAGTDTWTFTPVAAGTTTLEFPVTPPGNSSTKTDQATFTITVTP